MVSLLKKREKMITRKLIELESKRDGIEYAKKIIDSVLNQEINKIAISIAKEKNSISERYESSGNKRPIEAKET